MLLGFPLPYPDELIYSTIARYRVHSGIVSAKELLKDVFGNTRIIASSDLLGYLELIAGVYPEQLNVTPSDLLYRHTLFPIYAPFIGEARRQRLTQELFDDNATTIHLTAGIVASRIKQPSFLRYCPECVIEQVREKGECYWLRKWQISGVESCPKHGNLIDSRIGRHDIHRHSFTAPNLENCPWKMQSSGAWQCHVLAENISELLNLNPSVVPDFSQWSGWYKHLAKEQGLTRGKHVCHRELRDRVINFWGTSWLAKYGLLTEVGESYWLKNLFRKHRKAFSYLEHLIAMHTFLKPPWKLSDVIHEVAQFEPELERNFVQPPVVNRVERTSKRKKWLCVVKEHGTKVARSKGHGDIYAWLYRYDRHWLIETNAKYQQLKRNHKHKWDWEKRDRRIVKALIRIRNQKELSLSAPRCSKSWYLNQLEHKVGIEKNLHLLPLCNQFFELYSESVWEYQVRRITKVMLLRKFDTFKIKRWRVLRLSGLSEERLTSVAKIFLKEILKF